MHLDRRLRGVGLVDDVLERVKSRLEAGILGSRLYPIEEVGVAAATNLNYQGVEVALPRIGDKLIDLPRILESIMKRINPQGSEFRRILVSLGMSRGSRHCQQDQ